MATTKLKTRTLVNIGLFIVTAQVISVLSIVLTGKSNDKKINMVAGDEDNSIYTMQAYINNDSIKNFSIKSTYTLIETKVSSAYVKIGGETIKLQKYSTINFNNIISLAGNIFSSSFFDKIKDTRIAQIKTYSIDEEVRFAELNILSFDLDYIQFLSI
ncbi:MAG: hypothetical protein Ta2E_03470 [Mycoplasmoidaceae bacterium]|nr:MAG: hypothetical protein Ta2E_03470 [Mycoplasmoidaceae bacterium]